MKKSDLSDLSLDVQDTCTPGGTIFAKTITTLSSQTAMTDFPTRNSVLQRPKNWKEKTKLEFLSLTTEKRLALRNTHSCSF